MKKIIALLLFTGFLCANGFTEKAKTLFEEQKFEEAKNLFLQAIEENENSAEAFYYLARISYYNGELDEAIEYCEEAVELVDDNAEYHFWMGQLYGREAQQSGIFKQATLADDILEHFERAVELDPNHLGGNIGLAQFYWHAPGIVGGDIDKAIALANKVVKLSEVEGYNLLAGIYTSEERYNDAFEAIQKFIIADELKGRMALARFYYRSEKPAEAEAEMEKVEILIGDNPEYFWFYNSFGYRLLRENKIDKAILKFEKQVKLSPQRANPHDSLGEAYLAAGRLQDALASFNKALEINPELESAKEKIAEIEQSLQEK